MPEPFRPHDGAIFFKPDAVSGGTLGYFCTIQHVCSESLDDFPNDPSQWTYRVFVPYLGQYLVVPSRELFVTSSGHPTELPATAWKSPADCEVRFDGGLASDNQEIRGVYRLVGHNWVKFVFYKCDKCAPEYQLSLPRLGAEGSVGALSYGVPATECLSEHFVLTALASIVGERQWDSSQL